MQEEGEIRMNDPVQLAAPQPLRVVHVTFSLDMGGLERLLLEIAGQTDPKRVQLFFVSLGSTGTSPSRLAGRFVASSRRRSTQPAVFFGKNVSWGTSQGGPYS